MFHRSSDQVLDLLFTNDLRPTSLPPQAAERRTGSIGRRVLLAFFNRKSSSFICSLHVGLVSVEKDSLQHSNLIVNASSNISEPESPKEDVASLNYLFTTLGESDSPSCLSGGHSFLLL